MAAADTRACPAKAPCVGVYLGQYRKILALQPGPAALTDGVQQLQAIIARWRSENDQ